jgi:hypothetical protein
VKHGTLARLEQRPPQDFVGLRRRVSPNGREGEAERLSGIGRKLGNRRSDEFTSPCVARLCARLAPLIESEAALRQRKDRDGRHRRESDERKRRDDEQPSVASFCFAPFLCELTLRVVLCTPGEHRVPEDIVEDFVPARSMAVFAEWAHDSLPRERAEYGLQVAFGH